MYTFFSIICPACDPDLTAGQILGMCVLDSKEQRRDALKLGFVFCHRPCCIGALLYIPHNTSY